MADPARIAANPRAVRPTRREFLKVAALAAGAVLVPTLVTGSALGMNGAVPASERIVLGGIGIGGRGTGDLGWMLPEKDVQFVAICDAQKARREAVKRIVDKRYGNNDCAMYRDMREFLATRTDIDALLIATGDRWHALAAIMAMRAGKDVYSEKPSSMTIAEGQAVVETAARRYGRVYQTGTQRLSEDNFTFANELLRTGRLGKVHTVRAHIAPWDAAEMKYDWLPGRARAAQGRGGLGRVARAVPVAALQRRLRPRRLARLLRFPHQLHRRMGRPHVRPVPWPASAQPTPRPSNTDTSTTPPATAWSPSSPTA